MVSSTSLVAALGVVAGFGGSAPGLVIGAQATTHVAGMSAAGTRPAPVTKTAAPAKKRVAVKKPTVPVKKPVVKKPLVATAVFQSRITAGTRPVTDSAGRVWQPRPVEFGSWRMSTSLKGVDIAGTADDGLYQVGGFDVKWYRLAVPASATYRVRILMAESYWSQPGKRVFDIRAEGRTVISNLDLVKVAGKARAHDVTFTVPVRDGELTLEFPASRDYSLLSAIEVVSTAPVARPRPAAVRRAVTFAPGSVWTQQVGRAPLADNSTAVVADLVRQVADHYGGTAAFNAYEYNTAFHVAAKGQRRVDVGFYDCQRKGQVPSGLYDGPRHFQSVPVPDDAAAAVGTDAMMSIYDPAADQIWEFWQMRRTGAGGWQACWGGRLDQVSRKQGYFPSYYGTSASGMVLAGGMITIDEVRAGAINHAIALAVVESQAWPKVSWPAQRTDGGTRDPNVVMHGQRLRLDPSLDVSTYDLTPIGRMVATAAQRYGFIVVDRAGLVGVSTESGRATARRTGVNPWDRLLGGPSYLAMKNFPWDRLQALPPDYGKVAG
ncbi:MAG: hypothetical protein IPI32_01705 [Austwickia sp.]|nr:hypothetical protein [Austwickia sp.]MBK8437676.1 hypothetical protein [Austwickia sp.]MBK9099987.1 hypothetical protein [Austwickia sp.]